ncbi:MAG: DUF4258 domain-containing protein [Polyangiaceae bacterium]|nr:DUF4258 domain-containing protein [Polyangiaceae bacterium]
MDASQALEIAKGAARVRRLRFVGPHVTDRMNERQATREDIVEAVRTATTATVSTDGPGRWRIAGGVDLDGDDLSVVVRIDGNFVWVVTIF